MDTEANVGGLSSWTPSFCFCNSRGLLCVQGAGKSQLQLVMRVQAWVHRRSICKVRCEEGDSPKPALSAELCP